MPHNSFGNEDNGVYLEFWLLYSAPFALNIIAWFPFWSVQWSFVLEMAHNIETDMMQYSPSLSCTRKISDQRQILYQVSVADRRPINVM